MRSSCWNTDSWLLKKYMVSIYINNTKVFFFPSLVSVAKQRLPSTVHPVRVVCYVLSTLGALSVLIIISRLIENELVGAYFCGGTCLWPHVQVSVLKSELL